MQYGHKKSGVVECLDKYEVACFDEDVVACFYEGVLACLYYNNKDGFYGYFLHTHPLEYLLEETLGGQFLVHHGFMYKLGWCETYAYFSNQHNYKNQIVYHDRLNCGSKKVWYET